MRPPKSNAHGALSWLALFGSSGTLICCALPIILVTLGAGATIAALTHRSEGARNSQTITQHR